MWGLLRLGNLVFLVFVLYTVIGTAYLAETQTTVDTRTQKSDDIRHQMTSIRHQMTLITKVKDVVLGNLENEMRKIKLKVLGMTAEDRQNMELAMTKLYKAENDIQKTRALLEALSQETSRQTDKMSYFWGLITNDLDQNKMSKFIKFQAKKMSELVVRSLHLLKEAGEHYSKDITVLAEVFQNGYKKSNTNAYGNLYMNVYGTSNKRDFRNPYIHGYSISNIDGFQTSNTNSPPPHIQAYVNSNINDNERDSQYLTLIEAPAKDLEENKKNLSDCGLAEIMACVGEISAAIAKCVSHPDFSLCIEEIMAAVDAGCKDCLPWLMVTRPTMVLPYTIANKNSNNNEDERDSTIALKDLTPAKDLEENNKNLGDCGLMKFLQCFGNITEAIEKCVNQPVLDSCIDEIIGALCKDCVEAVCRDLGFDC